MKTPAYFRRFDQCTDHGTRSQLIWPRASIPLGGTQPLIEAHAIQGSGADSDALDRLGDLASAVGLLPPNEDAFDSAPVAGDAEKARHGALRILVAEDD